MCVCDEWSLLLLSPLRPGLELRHRWSCARLANPQRRSCSSIHLSTHPLKRPYARHGPRKRDAPASSCQRSFSRRRKYGASTMASILGFSLPAVRIPPVFSQVANHGKINSTDHAAVGASPPPSAASSASPPAFMDSLLLSAGRSSPLLQVGLFVYRVLGAHLGLDPSILLTAVGLLWAFFKLGSQLWQFGAALIDQHLMCAMYVSEGDHIYTYLMKWLSQHPALINSQYLTAQTSWETAWEDEGEESWESLLWTDGGEGDGKPRYLNFSNQEARLVSHQIPSAFDLSFLANLSVAEPALRSCTRHNFVLASWYLLPGYPQEGDHHVHLLWGRQGRQQPRYERCRGAQDCLLWPINEYVAL